jgi:hypothetical protein
MPTLALNALVAGLEATAASTPTDEAAVALLVAHDHWLHRPDFVDCLVMTDRERCSPPVAWIYWHEVPAFLADAPCSSSEAAVLRIAASLAGHDPQRPLAELLSGLDDTNAAHVADALAHVLTRGGRRPLPPPWKCPDCGRTYCVCSRRRTTGASARAVEGAGR